ncbi:hypothetical protein MNB_SV-6-1147 [hydrothermal vent metagenome]|uniref:Uncharacterized protein n=1 Tax=hydrothermal vent metagenome TaxID=652676 RepID=A0A1W1C0X8_9ZZZZ
MSERPKIDIVDYHYIVNRGVVVLCCIDIEKDTTGTKRAKYEISQRVR